MYVCVYIYTRYIYIYICTCICNGNIAIFYNSIIRVYRIYKSHHLCNRSIVTKSSNPDDKITFSLAHGMSRRKQKNSIFFISFLRHKTPAYVKNQGQRWERSWQVKSGRSWNRGSGRRRGGTDWQGSYFLEECSLIPCITLVLSPCCNPLCCGERDDAGARTKQEYQSGKQQMRRAEVMGCGLYWRLQKRRNGLQCHWLI